MFLNALSSKIPGRRSCFLLAGSSVIWVGAKDNILGLFASTSPKMVTESHQGPVWVSACRERRRTCRGSRRLPIWCCSRPPSDGAGNSNLGKPHNFPFLGLRNLFRDKIFLDVGHRRPAVLLFQFWILTGSAGWRNDTGCQWWSSFGSFGWMVLEEIESLSKTTKLLLLDSLLQEVCIVSGSHVSHNLLYSGLKKAHSKKII